MIETIISRPKQDSMGQAHLHAEILDLKGNSDILGADLVIKKHESKSQPFYSSEPALPILFAHTWSDFVD